MLALVLFEFNIVRNCCFPFGNDKPFVLHHGTLDACGFCSEEVGSGFLWHWS